MDKLSPERLILVASSISLEIAKGKTLQEINAYKNFFSLISNNLSAIAQQKLFSDKKEK